MLCCHCERAGPLTLADEAGDELELFKWKRGYARKNLLLLIGRQEVFLIEQSLHIRFRAAEEI